MKPALLSLRFTGNDDHHLWNNNGTWWIHYTLHLPDFTKRRVRRSLGTRDRLEARRRRDVQLVGVSAPEPARSEPARFALPQAAR